MILRVLIVGQAPGPSRQELPFEGRSGQRLAALLGLQSVDELRREADLANLLDSWPGRSASGKGDAFPPAHAAAAAAVLDVSRADAAVACGRGVARAMGLAGDYLEWRWWRGLPACCLPHPSGVNRWWNAVENRCEVEAWARRLREAECAADLVAGVRLDGAQARAWRGSRSQAHVARRAGMSERTLGAIERDERADVTLSRAVKLAHVLGCELEEILRREA